MMMGRLSRIGAVACAAVLASAMLAGCLGPAAQVDDPSKQYRTYMSQMNQIMVDLDESLDAFTDAVSQSDTVNIESRLEQALKSLDKIEGLDVPAGMDDIQKSYVSAAEALEGALRDYTALYAEIDTAVRAEKADWSDYKDRITAIQKAYDSGVKALKDADAAAAKAGTF